MEGSGGVVGLLRNICTETKNTKRLWLLGVRWTGGKGLRQ